MARSIAIISLGGAAGKTTLALNLAMALHQLNHKVIVLDADFTKDNMMEHLGLHNMPVSLDHVFNEEAHIHDAVYKHFTGLKIIPSQKHDYGKFSYHFEDLLADHDYIILDTPSNLDALRNILPNIHEAIIVHDPKYSSKIIVDAGKMLSENNILNLGVVLNNFSPSSVDEIHRYHVLEKLPASSEIRESFRIKNPLLHTHPKSEAAKRIYLIARKIE